MNSEQIKDEVVRKILSGCLTWLDEQHRQQLEHITRIALHNVELCPRETALSTEVLIPNDEYVKQFLAIKMVKGCTDKTIRHYGQTLQMFFREVDIPVTEITTNDIRVYLAIRKTRDGVSNSSLDNELRVLRSFFGTMLQEELVTKNPTLKIEKIKSEKKKKEAFSDKEVELLRRAATSPRHPIENPKRDLAIIEVLYSTGCRVTEMCNIKLTDIQGDRVRVLGKGNKERYVYLNARAQVAIEDYLSCRTDQFDWLFPGGVSGVVGHNVVVDAPITKDFVGELIRKLGKRAGVSPCHPHRFRRTAATVALRRGMPIEQVSKMLGHEQLTTTQIYIDTQDEEVQMSHKKYLS